MFNHFIINSGKPPATTRHRPIIPPSTTDTTITLIEKMFFTGYYKIKMIICLLFCYLQLI